MKEKLIVTSALYEHWDKKKENILLGEWCRIHSERSTYEKFDYQVNNYLWEDRTKFTDIYNFCLEEFDAKLKSIRDFLNKKNNEDKDEKFYKIVLWHWLIYIIFQYYDKFLTLKDVKNNYPRVMINVIPKSNHFVPFDTNKFLYMLSYSDRYNSQLYSIVARELEMNLNIIPHKRPLLQTYQFKNRISFFKKIINILNKFLLLISKVKKGNKVIFTKLLFKYNKFITYLLIFRSNFKIISDEFDFDYSISINDLDYLSRNEILESSKLHCKTKEQFDFSCFLDKQIMKDLPIVYLEGFKDMQSIASSVKYKNVSKVITAQSSYNYQTIFNFWYANNKDKIKLIIHQHGGWNCTHKLALEEIHWTIGDEIWTYGSTTEEKQVPMYNYSNSINISKFRNIINFKNKKIKSIYILLSSCPRYHRSFSASHTSSEILIHLKEIIIFLKLLPKDFVVTIRCARNDYKWNIKNRILEHPYRCKILIDEGENNFLDQLKLYDLIITNYFGTTHLESIAANIPTMILYNTTKEMFSKNMYEMVVKLNNVNVTHTSAKKMYDFIMSIRNMPMQWWGSNELQNTLKEYNRKFSNIDKKWFDKWLNRLEIDF